VIETESEGRSSPQTDVTFTYYFRKHNLSNEAKNYQKRKDGNFFDQSLNFLVATVVQECSPQSGPQSGGQLVTISGNSFGASPSELLGISLAGIPCQEVIYISRTRAHCISGPANDAVILFHY